MNQLLQTLQDTPNSMKVGWGILLIGALLVKRYPNLAYVLIFVGCMLMILTLLNGMSY